jgi:crossover junction endodeoxyribonuclease RusA
MTLLARSCVLVVELPFPPSILSGHATHGKGWDKTAATKKWRRMAARAVTDAGGMVIDWDGDITIHYHFIMPDRRSDRTNAYRRCKALEDGIADALAVNDKRFLPSISFEPEPCKPGMVIVTIGGE